MKVYLPLRRNASELVLIMMVAAILSLLSARLFLELTNYPQLGRGDWHVAHTLWGGVLMVGGMMIGLVTHGERFKKVAAGTFGVGLGWFVDEMGKYLSSDGDYFFQPAIVLMYIFFVLIFLFYRYLDKTMIINPKTLLYQAISELEEIAEKDLGEKEQQALIEKLDRIIKKVDPAVGVFVVGLKKLIKQVKVVENKQEKWSQRWWGEVKRFSYHKVFRQKFILYLLLSLAFIYIIGGIYDTVIFGRFLTNKEWWYGSYGQHNLASVTETTIFFLKMFFDLVTSVLFVWGIFWVVKKKKNRGIMFFRYGLLVNIFLSSVFKFYLEQFSGVFSLMASVVVLVGLERLKKERII